MTKAVTVLRTTLKEMGKNWRWNCWLIVLKMIEVILTRPLTTNFKLTTRAHCAVSVCSPSPIILSTDYLWQEAVFGQVSDPHFPSLSAGIWNKTTSCFPPFCSLYWLWNGKQQDPTFGEKWDCPPRAMCSQVPWLFHRVCIMKNPSPRICLRFKKS